MVSLNYDSVYTQDSHEQVKESHALIKHSRARRKTLRNKPLEQARMDFRRNGRYSEVFSLKKPETSYV